MFGLVSRVPAGHDEFRGIGVSDQILALGSAVRQTDCPMSGFRPLWFITRLAPLRLTGGSPPELCSVQLPARQPAVDKRRPWSAAPI